MGHKKGRGRKEQLLMPPSLEDYVSKDNPVRLIDAFVDKLDLISLGYKHAVSKAAGRPPYDPADLLKLFIYGYMNRVPSTRRLERQTQVNIEVKWLTGDVTPDFKTIARFRADNGAAIEKTFDAFVEIGLKRNFFGKIIAALDGSRFKGVNSLDKIYTKDKTQRIKDKTREKLREYIRQVEEMDKLEEDPERFTEEELQKKIAEMEKELEKLQDIEKKLNQTEESQIATTDPDSRLMKIGSKVNVGYNVQVVVESERKLIVAFQVTNDRADVNNLFSMSQAASRALDSPNLIVLADSGYYDCEEVKKCQEAGLTPFINEPDQRLVGDKFTKRQFEYDPATDQYKCPAGQKLSFIHKINKGDGRILNAYGTKACRSCSIRARCTTSPKGRFIQRHPHEHVLEAMAARVKAHPRLMRKRKAIIEHVFGCLKSPMNLREFLTKGFKNVTAEFSLAALAFDLKRLINDMGTTKLIASLG